MRAAERFRDAEGMLDTVLGAEPQVLITWESVGSPPRLLAANLPPALGVPRDPRLLLRFEDWLDGASAQALDQALLSLADEGAAFNLILRTIGGSHIEVDGRAVGGSSC